MPSSTSTLTSRGPSTRCCSPVGCALTSPSSFSFSRTQHEFPHAEALLSLVGIHASAHWMRLDATAQQRLHFRTLHTVQFEQLNRIDPQQNDMRSPSLPTKACMQCMPRCSSVVQAGVLLLRARLRQHWRDGATGPQAPVVYISRFAQPTAHELTSTLHLAALRACAASPTSISSSTRCASWSATTSCMCERTIARRLESALQVFRGGQMDAAGLAMQIHTFAKAEIIIGLGAAELSRRKCAQGRTAPG